MAEETFYDRVARKFGAAGAQIRHRTVYPEGNPEAIFERKIVELGDKGHVAMDLGCGKGGFTLRMAEHFREVVGIDVSRESLRYAQEEQQAEGKTNVRFELRNAKDTGFAADTFDLIYCRRGPGKRDVYRECFRIMKPDGYMLTIGIGERDAWDLKKVFGRGQGFWEWQTSAEEQSREQLQEVGFSVVFGQSFSYDEFYAAYEDLDVFLQSVPIFEDFDSEKDRASLMAYVSAFQTEQGIRLPRQRFITIARKL